MAAAILIRRNATRRDRLSGVDDEELDTRPMYLREFPRGSFISRDLKLGVLLGRYILLHGLETILFIKRHF
jgi:hypothetical protein